VRSFRGSKPFPVALQLSQTDGQSPQREPARAPLNGYSPNALTQSDILEIGRNITYLVDQILKGAKPGEIPIFQPTHFEFEHQSEDRKDLGIELRPVLVVRADNVIE